MENKICEIIRDLRKEKDLGQEALADAMGVSVQAVSKWETGNSLPDVALLPRIATFFGVTVDYLFFGPRETSQPELDVSFTDDGVLRVVQFIGSRMVTKNEFGRKKELSDFYIPLAIDQVYKNAPISIEIWGSAKIEGDVGGSVEAGDSVNCGNVSAYVKAGDHVNCGNVSAYVEAGDGVNCGNVSAYVKAGDHVNCGNVGGNVSAGDEVKCGDVNGSVECEGDLYCKEIKGDVHCNGDIHIEKM